jgi:hypothetical protein
MFPHGEGQAAGGVAHSSAAGVGGMPWRLNTVPLVTVTRVPAGNAALSTAIRASRSHSSVAETERRMVGAWSLIALHDRHFPAHPQKLWTAVQAAPARLVRPGLHSLAMAFQRGIDGSDPVRGEPIAATGGAEELRRVRRSRHLATGTMACPACDAPVAPAGRMRPADAIGCPYCGTSGAVRDFLSLDDPARPARVEVRVVRR